MCLHLQIQSYIPFSNWMSILFARETMKNIASTYKGVFGWEKLYSKNIFLSSKTLIHI